MTCDTCGRKFPPPSLRRAKFKRFCSGKCRSSHYNMAQDARLAAMLKTLVDLDQSWRWSMDTMRAYINNAMKRRNRE